MAGASQVDRVVALGAKITELRRQLATCESELASLLRDRTDRHDQHDRRGRRAQSRARTRNSPKSNARIERSEGRADGLRGTTAKIVGLLASHPRDVYDAAEVARHLGANIASVRVMLKRLVESKKIRRTGRGAYRAR
jgi:hypothetical protein